MIIIRHKEITYSIIGAAMEVHRVLEADFWSPYTTRLFI